MEIEEESDESEDNFSDIEGQQSEDESDEGNS
jgi:hypothetical protein